MSKKPMIIVGLIFGLIIVFLMVYLILSITTDLFKPTSEVFQKYLTKSVDKIDDFLDFSKEQELINILQNSNYKESSKINLKYLNSKNENEIFSVLVNGIVNNSINNSFKTIGINYGEEEFMNLEYLRENQTKGLLFKDIVKQFISSNAENVEEILKYFDVYVDDSISSDSIEKRLKPIADKKEELQNIIIKEIKEIGSKKYNKKRKAQITLNKGDEKNVTEYSLKMTEDDVKKIYLEFLKTVDNQEEINRISNPTIKLPEIIIYLYVEKGNVLSAKIDTESIQIDLYFYDDEVNIKFKNVLDNDNYSTSINVKKEEQNKKIDFEDSYRNNINLTYSINKDSNKQNTNIQISIKNDNIKSFEVNAEQEIEISENLIEGIEKKFENISSFNLSTMNDGTRNIALNDLIKKIDALISSKNSKFNSEILDMIIELDKRIQIHLQEIKEKQKREFNNQFLPYEGQQVDKEAIFNLLELIGRNVEKYVTTGEDKYRVFILEGSKNTKLVEELKEKIEKADKDFSVKFEYNSEGKINAIRIQGYENKN